MQVNEIETIENPALEEHENSRIVKGTRTLEEDCGKSELNLGSAIDVSGKILDFPLIDVGEDEVEEVYLYKNELNLIPRVVGKFQGLKTLKFFANEINLFPGEFKNLVELECLQVKVSVPGLSGLELSKLKNLKELELCRVPPRPSAYPVLSEIAGLKCLTRLSVCHFSIRYLPPEIGYLENLEYLDISFNKMRILPDEIASLNLLVSLKVANNKLTQLPSGLSYLHRLENLDLSSNRLTSLGSLELESMRTLKNLDLQHNQLYDCQIPSWICCKLEGNVKDLSTDETAEMDVYEGVIQEIHNSPCSSTVSSSQLVGSSPNNRCLAARRSKGWKRRYILQTKARQERLDNCKKWKVDETIHSSSEKCTMCRVSVHSDDALSKDVSVVAEAEFDCKDLLVEGEMHGGSPIIPGDEDLSVTKNSVDGCLCSAIDSEGMHKEAERDGSEDDAVLDSVLDAAKVAGEGSSSETSNSVQKSKRHYEKDIDNPKPAKSRRPTDDPSLLSCQYSERSFCGVGDYLPDGFYDAGRDRRFMPLDSYEKNLQMNSREVILLDRERDEELDSILLRARKLVYQFKQMNRSIDKDGGVVIDNLQIASLLALFVSDHFGGSDKCAVVQRTRKAVSGSNCKKPFICTCTTGMSDASSKTSSHGLESVDDIVFHDICEKSLRFVKERRSSTVVPIGDLKFGVCRHRALLLKYLCDRMKPRIPCELVRGYLDFLPHAWNVIVIEKGQSLVRMIVDACHPHEIRRESDPEYACRYIPLSHVYTPFTANEGASRDSSFPSVSISEEIGKMASTTLMRCNLGSLEAAMKVRTMDVSEASADEVRNFELSCLGEVRLLRVLKHSCIVELYGHQISSKWSVTAENSGDRSLQSAILMEHIKGGSLKSYLEKLSNSGEKHVALDLALSIARDVAFALTELHSKHIIHRDIKSENVLIDLEEKKHDGSPVVKICDFDRAIPLHSYLHTCCIAHVGVPPPNICVGTPRWMAPEVLRSMHDKNTYGLEVDVWSYGCLLLELLTLQVPYSVLPESEIHNLLQMGQRPRLTDELEELAEMNKEIENKSNTLWFLVKLYRQCTEKNPDNRPSAENIYNLLLNHMSSINSSSPEQE
ncbi:ras guanine nucleotide exchange factor L [Dorcoceras hygrometricum]|uniref:Ras guanine nucleotide exchange factor L n=1 Tax=Dorcoceras hygrometricum TaxID=472368 RepID=A0A2Z7AVS1_9LAMI|nr:ras guanine nucleotide exchange factor L [Dorcoceras hygrometricum]